MKIVHAWWGTIFMDCFKNKRWIIKHINKTLATDFYYMFLLWEIFN